MGAGLAGLTSAWALAKEGHEVVVIDREPEVAAASSSANGGIIAASRAYPWSPGEVGRALRQALSRFDPELWLWGMRHLFQRSGGSYRRVLEAKVRLARYSQQAMREIAREIGFDGLRSGVLYLYRDAGALDAAWKRAATMRSLGFEIQLLQTPGITELEPAIDASRLAGALYAPGDESGDPALFCRSLAERLRPLGVQFSLENEIVSIEPAGARVGEIVTRRGRVRSDAFVCALGVMDRRLRRGLGVHVPVYPVKGFSASVPLARADAAPRHAMIDESRRVALSPFGPELRITGGAEFAGYDASCQPQDFAPLYDAAKQLLPGALDYARARARACHRPMTPETTPRFGIGRYHNLWFNIGLGHMGFTMAAGAARITADLVCGRTPGIDLKGLGVRRH